MSKVSTSRCDLKNVSVIRGTIRLAENDDSKVCDSILQIDHLLGRNKVK